ncbi:hypothetical protein OAN307_c29740 [Octadecabacter antarcticus 307]|uniref:LysM domain-containing protein n=1 Tax=Octadecabacter antarcticus 307 TaxID=391626 RepID=M9R7B6_9RHOB|nr:hypothetical protein [Octadecabacter antarcticus]AGI68524.1 hypothetical protein OAN307_c29740 [Octadecabacter antarcticus 307]
MRFSCIILLLAAIPILPMVAQAGEPMVFLYTTNSPEANSEGQGIRHVITRGETLLGVLRQHYGVLGDTQHSIEQVVADNQQAFRQGNANLMIAGQTLILRQHDVELPQSDDIYFF